MKDIVVAIDGYSGTGKSSTAKKVAKELSYVYLDSGAMYRAITLHFNRLNVDLANEELVNEALKSANISFRFEDKEQKVLLNGQIVDDAIRAPDVSNEVSKVAAIPKVRRDMVRLQRQMGSQKRVVMDGRDIGTVVFPDAELKVFMVTDIDVRTNRRLLELTEKGVQVDYKEVKENLMERDHIDTTREDSPLKKASDAIELDTSHLTFEEQVSRIVEMAKTIINES